jgi:hypothetical protein
MPLSLPPGSYRLSPPFSLVWQATSKANPLTNPKDIQGSTKKLMPKTKMAKAKGYHRRGRFFNAAIERITAATARAADTR